jgi:hypothetical protein
MKRGHVDVRHPQPIGQASLDLDLIVNGVPLSQIGLISQELTRFLLVGPILGFRDESRRLHEVVQTGTGIPVVFDRGSLFLGDDFGCGSVFWVFGHDRHIRLKVDLKVYLWACNW